MDAVKKNWSYLFLTNFIGVFNDNFLKHCIIFISVTWNLPAWLSQSQLISAVAAALVFPYLLFSPLAGRLAIRHSKLRIWQLLKLMELPVMLLASIAFVFHWVGAALLSVLLLGILSCLYSPSKYGLIRDVGGREGVSFGSGIFETMAFMGILIGSVAAPILSDHYQTWILISIIMLMALLGYLTSLRMKVVELPEETDPTDTINPLKFLVVSYRYAKEHPYINSAVLGTSVFWMIGGMIQMNVVIHCVHTLGTTNSIAGLILCCAAVGIALGCTAAGLLAKKAVRPEMIPIGLIGMMLSLAALLYLNPSVWGTGFLVFSLAFMGGLLEVPCMALVQHANLGRKLGEMIAYLNLVNFVFVLIGTGLFSLTTYLTHDNSLAVFAVILIVCSLTLIYFLLQHPEFFTGKKSLKSL
ncbi:MAG TPA: MFS transporter [Bacteroidales bacterium]|nr:MFS transporter [Bacteroidales bacterium]